MSDFIQRAIDEAKQKDADRKALIQSIGFESSLSDWRGQNGFEMSFYEMPYMNIADIENAVLELIEIQRDRAKQAQK